MTGLWHQSCSHSSHDEPGLLSRHDLRESTGADASTRVDIPPRRAVSDLRIAVHLGARVRGHCDSACGWRGDRGRDIERCECLSSARRPCAATAPTGMERDRVRTDAIAPYACPAGISAGCVVRRPAAGSRPERGSAALRQLPRPNPKSQFPKISNRHDARDDRTRRSRRLDSPQDFMLRASRRVRRINGFCVTAHPVPPRND